MENGRCQTCPRIAGTLHYYESKWVCDDCYQRPDPMDKCLMFEYGHENPLDSKGSTAHIRDIKSRRLDPKTGKMFHYSPPKSYFFTR